MDVSVVQLRGDIKEVLASCGDTALGGDDFALQVRLTDIAERTKIALSTQPYVSVNEVAVTWVDQAPVNLSLEVSRQEFDELTEDLLDKTHTKVMEALDESRLSVEDIDRRRVPSTRSIRKPAMPIILPPSSAVTPISLSAGPRFFILLREQQKQVEVDVFQGESRSCRENTLVDSFCFDLKPAPANAPVTVEFSYDLQGIVQVTVSQKGYDNTMTVAVDLKKTRTGGDEEGIAEVELNKKPINSIAQRARALLANPRIPAVAAKELESLTHRYEAAIVTGNDEGLIDVLEDDLLELMDQLMDDLESHG